MGQDRIVLAANVLRILFGLDFLLNGVNFYFPFFEIPPPPNPDSRALVDGLIQSGFFEIVKIVEVTTGTSLLLNRFVPLMLVTMMPLTVAIFWVDCVLNFTPRSYMFGLTTTLLNISLLILYLKNYLPLLGLRAGPGLPTRHQLAYSIFGRDR